MDENTEEQPLFQSWWESRKSIIEPLGVLIVISTFTLAIETNSTNQNILHSLEALQLFWSLVLIVCVTIIGINFWLYANGLQIRYAKKLPWLEDNLTNYFMSIMLFATALYSMYTYYKFKDFILWLVFSDNPTKIFFYYFIIVSFVAPIGLSISRYFKNSYAGAKGIIGRLAICVALTAFSSVQLILGRFWLGIIMSFIVWISVIFVTPAIISRLRK